MSLSQKTRGKEMDKSMTKGKEGILTRTAADAELSSSAAKRTLLLRKRLGEAFLTPWQCK